MTTQQTTTASIVLSVAAGFLAVSISSLSSGVGAAEPAPLRGDANASGDREITDAIVLLNFLFGSGPYTECQAVGDCNADASINITDPVFLLTHLFGGGEAPPPLSRLESRLCEIPSAETVERGRLIYTERDARGNVWSCATCHDIVPEGEAALTRPGHSLYDALQRPSYKNGAVATFLEAANVCRVEWLHTTPWLESGPDFQNFLDMVSFMNSVGSREPAEPLIYEIVPPAVEGPSQGDPDAGCRLFHTTCVVCHGEGAQGSLFGPSLVFSPLPYSPDYIRLRVRTSGNPNGVYEGLTGGAMPFWSKGRLSDAGLEDIVAYLVQRPPAECGESQ